MGFIEQHAKPYFEDDKPAACGGSGKPIELTVVDFDIFCGGGNQNPPRLKLCSQIFEFDRTLVRGLESCGTSRAFSLQFLIHLSFYVIIEHVIGLPSSSTPISKLSKKGSSSPVGKTEA